MNDSQWASAKLEEVCSLITDGSHFSPVTTSTGVPYVTVRDISNGKIDLTSSARISLASFGELERNGCRPMQHDVLFSKDGTVGKVALVQSNEPFVVLSSLAILRPMADLMIPAFFALCLQSSEFQLAATGQKTGLAIKRVVLKHLKKMSIPVPPLPVQRRIVDLMAHLDNQIANLRLERDAARGVLVASRRDFIVGATSSHRTPLGEMVESLDGRRRPVKSTSRRPGPYPYYGASGVVDHVDEWIFEGETLLISEDGANLRLRTTPIAFRARGRYWVNNHAHVVRATNGNSNAYLAHVIEAMDITLALTGTTMPKLNAGNLLALDVPLIEPLEQRFLSDQWDAIEESVESLAIEISACASLRTALLTSLLHKSYVLPTSYDSLLDGVA